MVLSFSRRSLLALTQNRTAKPVLMVGLILMIVTGGAAALFAVNRIVQPQGSIGIGKRHDFVVTICDDGALVQWFVAGGETLQSVSVRPATPITSSAFGLRARLLNGVMITIDEATVSVGETDADGWLDIEFATTPLTSGRRYGVHLTSAVLADGCFGLDATNNQRIGWGSVANAGLNVNGAMHPAQAIQMRVHAAGGVKPAVHMLAQAARGAPESAVALVIAVAAWFVTVVSLIFRLPGSRTNPWMKTIALTAAISLTAGAGLAGVAWLLG